MIVDTFLCATLEPPWKNNKPNISCIPEGLYHCKMRKSNKFGWCYYVTDVTGRSWILTHSGNLAGDRAKGFLSHTYGCILQGKYHGWLGGQKAVLVSKPTVRHFIEYMEKEEFDLKIQNFFEIEG